MQAAWQCVVGSWSSPCRCTGSPGAYDLAAQSPGDKRTRCAAGRTGPADLAAPPGWSPNVSRGQPRRTACRAWHGCRPAGAWPWQGAEMAVLRPRRAASSWHSTWITTHPSTFVSLQLNLLESPTPIVRLPAMARSRPTSTTNAASLWRWLRGGACSARNAGRGSQRRAGLAVPVVVPPTPMRFA